MGHAILLPESIDELKWWVICAHVALLPCVAAGLIAWRLVRRFRFPMMRVAVVALGVIWCIMAAWDWRDLHRDFAHASKSEPAAGADWIGIGHTFLVRYPSWLVLMVPAFTTLPVAIAAMLVPIQAREQSPRRTTQLVLGLIAGPGIALMLLMAAVRILVTVIPR